MHNRVERFIKQKCLRFTIENQTSFDFAEANKKFEDGCGFRCPRTGDGIFHHFLNLFRLINKLIY